MNFPRRLSTSSMSRPSLTGAWRRMLHPKKIYQRASKSIIFSRIRGYKPEDEIVFRFDKKKLLVNKKNIHYLYGQLKNAHQQKSTLSIDEAFYNYSGEKWADSKSYLLELLYLGCTNEILFVAPFDAKTNSTTFISKNIKPTLSPKDPAFPAWWEAHKSEWGQDK